MQTMRSASAYSRYTARSCLFRSQEAAILCRSAYATAVVLIIVQMLAASFAIRSLCWMISRKMNEEAILVLSYCLWPGGSIDEMTRDGRLNTLRSSESRTLNIAASPLLSLE